MLPQPLSPWVKSSPVRVTYRDTDQMGFVYYANYLVWLEIGRTDYIRQQGKSYKLWEEDNVMLPVRNCRIDYHSPARYDDMIVIESRVTKLTKISLNIEYKILRCNPEDKEPVLLAEAATEHIFMSKDGRPVRRGHEFLPELYEKFRLQAAYSEAEIIPTNNRL